MDRLQRRGVGLGTQKAVSEFAQRILGRARDLGMNKAQLAAKAGISRQTLENLLTLEERGGADMPSIRTFLFLGQALRVHPAWLMEGMFCKVVLDMRIDVQMDAARSPNVADLNYAEGAVAAPGTHFVKRWRVHNPTPEAWPGLRLVCQDCRLTPVSRRSGEPLHAADSLAPDVIEQAFPALAPGAAAEVAIGFTTPVTSGSVISRWLAVGTDGRPVPGAEFGLWVMVHVTTLADTLAFEPLPR